MKELSKSEYEIMEELWNSDGGLSVKQIQEKLRENKIDWKVQTITTFLTRMEKKGFVKSGKEGREKHYIPSISKNEIPYLHARGLVDRYFDGSVQKLIVALSGGKISAEKAKELEELIDNKVE